MCRDMKINIYTAEFCFKEMSGHEGWNWKIEFSDAAEYARNEIVRQMLAGDFTHLFFLDSDTFPPFGAIDKLLAHDKDIVAGVTPIFVGKKYWNYQKEKDERAEICNPSKELFKVARTGGTTILLKRKVFETMDWPYFRCDMHEDGSGLSHDYHFCDKATEKGFEIWIDSTIVCGHSVTLNLFDMI